MLQAFLSSKNKLKSKFRFINLNSYDKYIEHNCKTCCDFTGSTESLNAKKEDNTSVLEQHNPLQSISYSLRFNSLTCIFYVCYLLKEIEALKRIQLEKLQMAQFDSCLTTWLSLIIFEHITT